MKIIYIVHLENHKIFETTHHSNVSAEEFIKMSQQDGTFYTLEEFEVLFNAEDIPYYEHVMRIL